MVASVLLYTKTSVTMRQHFSRDIHVLSSSQLMKMDCTMHNDIFVFFHTNLISFAKHLPLNAITFLPDGVFSSNILLTFLCVKRSILLKHCKKKTKTKRCHDLITFHKFGDISLQGFVFQRHYIFTWWSVLPPKESAPSVSKQKLQELRSGETRSS